MSISVVFYHALLDQARSIWQSLFERPASLRQLLAAFFKKHRGLSQHQRRYLVHWLYTASRYYPAFMAYLAEHSEMASPEAPIWLALILLGEPLEDSPWSSLTPWTLWSFCATHPNLPDWLMDVLSPDHRISFSMMMSYPGTLDIRVNTLRTRVSDFLSALTAAGIGYHRLSSTATAVRLPAGLSLSEMSIWTAGDCDVQSEGSQYIAWQCAVRQADCVVDLCAGAGGKALAIAARMNNRGLIYACDIDAMRLSRLAPRQERLGVTNIRSVVLSDTNWMARLVGKADVVLVDAPCSGSGTWRRFPELKIRMTAEECARICETQRALLRKGAQLVKSRGQLVYATCSVAPQENEAQVRHFLAEHPDFTLQHAEQLWPMHWGDGFYYASLIKGSGCR